MAENWTKDDLRMYLLIYCANADFVESPEEMEYIKSKIGHSDFAKMHAEFEKDNDYQSIQKIQKAYEALDYASHDDLLDEIREFFKSDGEFDTLERNLMLYLKRVL